MELSALLPAQYDSYHFSEQVNGDQLTFDFLLQPGESKTRNAIKILELAGYPPEIIAEATNLSKSVLQA